MFNLYEYLSEKIAGDAYFNGIYKCTGLSTMEGMVDNVRTTAWPCIMVEVGDEGFIDMTTSLNDTRTCTFFILEKNASATSGQIGEMIARAKAKGVELLRQMRSDASNYGDKCFGIDFSKIDYMKIGPVGMSSYGYMFTFTFINQ